MAVVIILLTLLKRYLDPVEFGMSWEAGFLLILINVFDAADTRSYSGALLYTIYRDGTFR